MLRCVTRSRGALSLSISLQVLSGTSDEMESRKCAASILIEDGPSLHHGGVDSR